MSPLRTHIAHQVLTTCRGGLSPGQSARIAFGADQWEQRSGGETRDYLAQQLRAVLQDDAVPPVDPPPVDLLCGHATKVGVLSDLPI